MKKMIINNKLKSDFIHKEESLSNVDTSGRWTKEEHNLFVKALELHGKSWKLIQKTVKTRSIVQIRTHAQKYFLKIDKTKQSLEEQRRKEHTKKSHMKVSISPVLQPYLSLHNNNNMCTHSDAQKALYSFLSPSYGTMLTHTSTIVTQQLPVQEDEKLVDICYNTLTESNIHRCVLNREEMTVPDWFTTGGSIHSLLQIAELLDWDNCNTITSTNTIATTTTNVVATNATANVPFSTATAVTS